MKRFWKWVGATVAVLALLAVAAVLVIPFVVGTPRVRAAIARAASQAVGRPVTFTALSVTVLPDPSIRLHGLALADAPDFATPPPF
ncbi:MAG: AsmA family protein [Deltaproteobacteria bacterium]|nr:AsmA family protein [Deltaproteobacteria bacterium]